MKKGRCSFGKPLVLVWSLFSSLFISAWSFYLFKGLIFFFFPFGEVRKCSLLWILFICFKLRITINNLESLDLDLFGDFIFSCLGEVFDIYLLFGESELYIHIFIIWRSRFFLAVKELGGVKEKLYSDLGSRCMEFVFVKFRLISYRVFFLYRNVELFLLNSWVNEYFCQLWFHCLSYLIQMWWRNMGSSLMQKH